MVTLATKPKGPSRSANMVALLRAQHQVIDDGSIFSDPLAVPISGQTPDDLARNGQRFPQIAVLRQFMAARSRFAEDCLAKAVDRGVRQIVVLGAGFDTFGLRNPYADKGVRVFEVDRLASQRSKKQRIEKANLPIPSGLAFVAVDFENEPFLLRLESYGFDASKPAFFVWLGVVPYLSRKAIAATLSTIAKIPDAEIVFDYGEPIAALAPDLRPRFQAVAAVLKGWGEPWVSYFTPAEMRAGLTKLGFPDIEDLDPVEIAARYVRSEQPSVAHLVRARITASFT